MNPGHGEFLARAGVPSDCEIVPLAGGANNRVFQVRAGQRRWVLKQYFRRANDSRDRFAAEQDYYTSLWKAGVRGIPEPLAWNRDQDLGLFEFIEGRKLAIEEINRDRVMSACAFLVETNQKAGAARLKPASEACFSLSEHYATVDRRIARLAAVMDPAARQFVVDQLEPRWGEVAARRGNANKEPVSLVEGQRCISPSDFGFHNALLQPDGRLKFFDFEYAGVDDPAKLVCDFFCQPRLPASQEFWEEFTESFAIGCGWDQDFLTRARQLLPVYQIKWCCIMLNEFLRSEAERREFAGGTEALAERQRAQLEQARSALARVADPVR